MLLQSDEQRAEALMQLAEKDVRGDGTCTARWLPCISTVTTENNPKEKGEIMVDLSTTYLGLSLKNPLVASASPPRTGLKPLASWKNWHSGDRDVLFVREQILQDSLRLHRTTQGRTSPRR
jgi:hypothetical protein